MEENIQEYQMKIMTQISNASLKRRKDWNNLSMLQFHRKDTLDNIDSKIYEEIQLNNVLYSLAQTSLYILTLYLGYKCSSLNPNMLLKSFASGLLIIPSLAYISEKKRELADLRDILIYKYKHLL